MLRYIVLFLSLVVIQTSYSGQVNYPPFDITTMTQESDLVVYGKVESTEFVWRENYPPQCTTDITVSVENLLKGETNLGSDRIIFTLLGGTGTNPNTGETLRILSTMSPGLSVDDKVLLFLYVYPYPHLLTVPHGGLVLSKSYVRYVKNGNSVKMPYSIRESTMVDGQMRVVRKDKEVRLPLELVLQTIKASVEDPEETLRVEEKFRTYTKEALWKNRDKMPSKALLDEVKAGIDEILDEEEQENEK